METDRSRIIAYQRCPRERELAYHHLGTGLQRIRKSLPLQFGSAFHEGAEVLLTGEAKTAGEWGKHRVEAAVAQAKMFLAEQFSKSQIAFDGEQPEDLQKALVYGMEEQMALAEALLRAWWAFEGESFLQTFEVIEVEREGRAILAPAVYRTGPFCDSKGNQIGEVKQTFPPTSDELVLMFRPDALVRDRQSGDLYVVSWKTSATFGKRNVDQARHDMQSMSEVWGLEQARELKAYTLEACDTTNDYREAQDIRAHRIEGVLYKWIIKGRRSLDKWDNLYKQQSHLVYGWMKLGASPEETDWSWSYAWEKEDGSGESRLGKGWKKVPIWRDYPGGVKAWVEGLATHQIFPRHVDALAEVFPQAMPVERHQKDVESWKAQVIGQEISIQSKLITLDANPEALDVLFPQHTHSCHSFSGCQFIPICWEGVRAEPNELYQIRTANHPEKEDEE